jgi:hypothetical protein
MTSPEPEELRSTDAVQQVWDACTNLEVETAEFHNRIELIRDNAADPNVEASARLLLEQAGKLSDMSRALAEELAGGRLRVATNAQEGETPP